MAEWNSSFRKGDLEDAVSRPSEAGPLSERIDRLERAYQAELTASMSLNIRGTALAAVSSLAILLVAQFSAIWLDDSKWELSDGLDTLQRVLMPGSVAALLVCLVAAILVLWPSRSWAGDLKARLGQIGERDDDEEARLLLSMADGQRIGNERKARILRLASFPLTLAVVAIVGQSMIFAFDAQPQDAARPDAPAAVVEPSLTGLPPARTQQQLAELYAPLVYLHSEESFGPSEPAAFIEASALAWNRPRRDAELAARGEVDAERLGSGCERTSEGCYEYRDYKTRELTRPFLEAADRPAGLRSVDDRGFYLDAESSTRSGDLDDRPEQPVFYEFRTTREGVAITYWFFYGFSQPHAKKLVREVGGNAISHEGDWENIDVVLTADWRRPVAVFFYGHGDPKRKPWSDVCKQVRGAEDCISSRPGHPIVYSALGSHASYPTAGGTELRGKIGGKLASACDLREPARAWLTWGPGSDVQRVWDQPWYGFGGAWGNAAKLGDLTGPLGPSAWKLPADPDPGELESVRPCD